MSAVSGTPEDVAARYARLAESTFQEYGSAHRGGASAAGRAFRELWSRRQLLGMLVRRELKVRFKDSALGFGWTLIRPLMTLAIYYVAIGKFLSAERAIPDFAIFVFTGLTIWGLYNETITAGTVSVVQNAGLIKKVYLPSIVFPLSAAGSAFVTFLIQLGVLLLATLLLGQPPVAEHLGYGLAAIVLVVVWAVAIAIITSALNVYLRDVQHLVDVVLLVLFWASPIVYSWQLVDRQLSGDLAWLREVYLANPMTLAVIGFQQTFWRAGLDQDMPEFLWLRMLVAGIVGVLALLLAQRVFTRLQGDFAQEI